MRFCIFLWDRFFKLYQNNSKMVEVFQVFLFANLPFIGQVFDTIEEFNMLIKKAF